MVGLHLGKIEGELSTLMDMRMSGEISSEEFIKKKEEVVKRRNDLLVTTSRDQEKIYSSFVRFSSDAVELVKTLAQSYETADTEKKKLIVDLTSSNFLWDGESLIIKTDPSLQALLDLGKMKMVDRHESVVQLVSKLNEHDLNRSSHIISRLLGSAKGYQLLPA